MWQNHSGRLHLDCKVSKRHNFKASIIQDGDKYEIFLPESVAGAPLFARNKTKDEINLFLSKMELETLP